MKLEALVGGAAEVVGPETILDDVAHLMVDRSIDAVAVVERSDLVGIFTGHDLIRAIAEGVDGGTGIVADWMTPAPDVCAPDVPVAEAAAWLLETGYRHLLVMADDELLGIVGVRDLLWALTND